MKAILLVLTILAFSVNGFAKGKSASVKKSKYGFDWTVYYKLKFPDRQKYLQLYVEFVKELEAKNKVAANSEINLMNLIFPEAHAMKYGTDYCITGGIFYTPPCKALRSSEFPESIKPAFSGCTSGNRCAAYFGLDASGNGLCYKSESSATTECANQSNADAIQRLNTALANKYDPKSRALQTALDIDLKNNLIDKACLSASTKGNSCKKLAAAVETYRAKAGITGTTPPGTDIMTGDTGKGCSDAELQAITKEKGMMGNRQGVAHPVWYQMLKMGGLACGRSMEEMQKTMGVCLTDPRVSLPNVASDIQADNLSAAIRLLENNRTSELTINQKDAFANYFGMNTDDFKKVFCSKTAGQAYQSGNSLNYNIGAGGDAAKARREMFKGCLNSTIEKKTFNENGEKVDRYVSKNHYDVCRFQPARARFEDIISNPDKFKGKYFFSDNTSGNCYGLDKVSRSCSDIGTLKERQNSKLYCSASETPAAGTISTESNAYFRLEPVHKSDNMAAVADGASLTKNYTFYEYNCGSTTPACTSENNYCNDKTKEGDAAVK